MLKQNTLCVSPNTKHRKRPRTNLSKYSHGSEPNNSVYLQQQRRVNILRRQPETAQYGKVPDDESKLSSDFFLKTLWTWDRTYKLDEKLFSEVLAAGRQMKFNRCEWVSQNLVQFICQLWFGVSEERRLLPTITCSRTGAGWKQLARPQFRWSFTDPPDKVFIFCEFAAKVMFECE